MESPWLVLCSLSPVSRCGESERRRVCEATPKDEIRHQSRKENTICKTGPFMPYPPSSTGPELATTLHPPSPSVSGPSVPKPIPTSTGPDPQ